MSETISELYRLQKSMMAWMIEKDPAIQSDVASTSGVSTEIRLGIYGSGYGYRLIDALSENYPAVHTLMGDENFYAMTYAYMKVYPSKHFSLRYFGSELETFLYKYDPETPVFAEMARFEWALRNSFDAKNQTTITMDALQQVPIDRWGGLQFEFNSSVSRLDLEWNTPQLWAAIDAGSEPIPPEKLAYPYAWLVWRKDLLNYYRSLEVDEAWALDASLQGDSFGILCEGVCEWIDAEHAPSRVAGFLSQWIEDQLLIGIKYGD